MLLLLGEIMITFIAVVVSINFILICVNEYGSLDRAKNTIKIMNRYIDETQGLILKLEQKIDNLESKKNYE